MLIRKSLKSDIDAIEQIYSDIHTAEESGLVNIGWIRSVYPTRKTAEDALLRDDLFVMEDNGNIVGTAIINRTQVESYADGNWQYNAPQDKVMVLHTLVISPLCAGRGYGKSFVSFYEEYALRNNCPYLRMDTNAKNTNARALYKKLGYNETDVVPCTFNGIGGVQLVLLEKFIG